MEFFVKHEKEEDFTLVLPEPEDSECLDGHMDESIKNEDDEDLTITYIITEINVPYDSTEDPQNHEINSASSTNIRCNSEKLTKKPAKPETKMMKRCRKMYNNKHVVDRSRKQQIKSSNSCQCHCDICGKVYSKNYIRRHIVQHIKPSCKNIFICFTCQCQFKKKLDLLNHVKTHDPSLKVPYPHDEDESERKFKCQLCPWRFEREAFLKNHVAYIHSDSRPCKCKTCGKSFKLQNALRDHERSVHIEERPNACSYCDKGFKLVHHLKEHILRMHEKPKERKFACTLCEKKFFNHHDLNVHEKRSHGKV